MGQACDYLLIMKEFQGLDVGYTPSAVCKISYPFSKKYPFPVNTKCFTECACLYPPKSEKKTLKISIIGLK